MLAHIIKSESLVKQMKELETLKGLLQELQEHTHASDRKSYIAANVKLHHVYLPDVEEVLNEVFCKKYNITDIQKKYITSKLTEKYLYDMWQRFCEEEADYFLEWLKGYSTCDDEYWDAEINKAQSKEHIEELYAFKKEDQILRRRLSVVDVDSDKVGFFGRTNGWFSFAEDRLEENICIIDEFFQEVSKPFNETEIIIWKFDEGSEESEVLDSLKEELDDLYYELEYTKQQAEDLLWLIEETEDMVKKLNTKEFFENEIISILEDYVMEQE